MQNVLPQEAERRQALYGEKSAGAKCSRMGMVFYPWQRVLGASWSTLGLGDAFPEHREG